ncbi:ATP synthase subunit I [Bowmanella denitrificans]|uniref:ATP synthase subunit I n=1 Tax=Bowmanella denitrificans TaxID=366582 RepID=UPI001559DB56|nr:ATP synthase subunit I [Bowmanella denitrificans]
MLARRVLIAQSLTGLLLSLATWWLWGTDSGLSALAGVCACVIPNAVFAHLAFRHAGASKNQLVVRSFSQGAKFKLILTIFFFVAVFQWPDMKVSVLFASFAATMMTQWVLLIRIKH